MRKSPEGWEITLKRMVRLHEVYLEGDEAKLDWNEQGAIFRQRAIEAGYVARGIPKKYGGSEQDPDVLKATIIGQEFRKAHAPGELRGIGPSMLVPTLLEKGEEWQYGIRK